MLAAGAAWRWPTFHQANYLQYASSRLSYSDVFVLHFDPMLCTTAYSPQSDLWILPFLALLACPWWIWLVVVVGDFLYDLAIFHTGALYAAAQGGGPLKQALTQVGWSVWGREAALGLIAAWAVSRMRGHRYASCDHCSARPRVR